MSNKDVGNYKRTLAADPCAYCGGPSTCLDHIDPRANGGSNAWGNLTAACQTCNITKGGRSLLGFLGGRAHRRDLDGLVAWDRQQRSAWHRLGTIAYARPA